MHYYIQVISNFQAAYEPEENVSLDESLLLYRGRLSFRQYIKGKKAKYGIKFYELCSPNGYVHNIELYQGKNEIIDASESKVNGVVLRYYNSVGLANKLLQLKTHITGTLRSNRKQNPKEITTQKLKKKNDYIWVRKGNVYVTKWKDKREVLCITTKYHPEIIEVANRFGIMKLKPKEIAEYNKYMSGVDRSDQLTSYYSSPRKTPRWYKKMIFHLLDLAVMNSYILFRISQKSEITLLNFRERLIRELIHLSEDIKDGRRLGKKTPNIPNNALNDGNIQIFLKKSQFRKVNSFVVEYVPNKASGLSHPGNVKRDNKPVLCVGRCFEIHHNQ
ncbi:hypothetical protein NQ314_011616 [Rhamnusium bicolor]|uniref:PiggyBac transposable element-derived protein domain-containing protein n=1 Tax=Rhamnusium bicolor TaxID=1586634 RepID=A0AAV8XHZ0_9CUCU|nr:hypothetical protein NQ314_011616 [Rhamnusium bicolor]